MDQLAEAGVVGEEEGTKPRKVLMSPEQFEELLEQADNIIIISLFIKEEVPMKTDIEIAQEAVMQPIKEVAASYGIGEDDLELYGKYKAKLSDELWEKVKGRPDGKLVLVTAINPTPAGEGKTTITVGLGEALGKMGKNAIIALREPSLDRALASKAEQQAAAMHRYFLWKI